MRSARIMVLRGVFALVCFLCGLCRGEEPKAPECIDATFLHVLVIADTDDPKTGHGAQANRDNVCGRFGQDVPAHRCRIHSLTGRAVSAEMIRLTVAQLPVVPTDSVFCYYTGPLVRDSDGASLALTHGPALGRAELLGLLEERGARLTVFLTDGCVDYKPPPGLASSLAPGPVQSFRYLFFRHRGVVDIDSATHPQAAWGYSDIAGTRLGGIFTAEMLDLLSAVDDVFDDDGVVRWAAFSRALASGTSGRFRQFRQKYGLRQQRQEPRIRQLAQPVCGEPIRSESKLGVQVVDAPSAGGALIVRVGEGSPAAWFGLREGEIIHVVERGIGQRHSRQLPVRTAKDLEDFVGAAFTSQLLRLHLRDRATGCLRKVFVRLHAPKP